RVALPARLSEKLLEGRREVERILQLRESILQNVNVWMMVLDSTGKILEWNTAAERISGYPAREVLGRNDVWREIYPDREYRRRITRQIREIVGEKKYFENLETTITCRDGSQKTILWDTRSLGAGPEGRETFVAIGTDITGLKRAQESLAANLNRMVAILRALPDLMFVISRDGTFHEFHCADGKMLVRPAEYYVGRSLRETGCPAGLAGRFTEIVRAALESKQLQQMHYSLATGGQTRHFEARTVAIDDERALVIVRDITDSVEREYIQQRFTRDLEEQVRIRTEFLEATLREKDLLLREVHHRVKNNLQVITSLLNLQIRSAKSPEVSAILRDTQSRIRAMALVHEKLYQSGDLSRIDICSYLRALVHQTFASHGTRPQKVTLSFTCETLSMDIGRAIPLGLIVNELVTNALVHAFPGDMAGTVTVRGERRGDGAEFSVADDGVGLPAGFDPERSTTLGLRLVYSLVAQLHGSIERLPAGRGTAFRLVIPGGG
ncbi:MAG: histidine kinase dimerization/phosphoacceptor domain -containing protein, partial [Methanolinea sp.]